MTTNAARGVFDGAPPTRGTQRWPAEGQGRASRRLTPEVPASPEPNLYAPLGASLAYLGGTYLLFLLIGQVGLVPDLTKLTLFIISTLVALTVGYRSAVSHYLKNPAPPIDAVPQDRAIRAANRWVVVSGLYTGLYGLLLLAEYGAQGIGDVITAILNPGAAYFAKFEVYEMQTATGQANLPLQVLTLLSILSLPLVPFLVTSRRELTPAARMVAFSGIALYASFFLFIGTLKGLGDLVIFAIAGYAVAILGGWRQSRGRALSRRQMVSVLLLLSAAFTGYMAYNQSDRLAQMGVTSSLKSNALVESIAGEGFAHGLAAVGFYPTHGYLGLSYSLDTPFVWTGGRGNSQALDSYLVQYLGTESVYPFTYPARTEARTGWPALRLWSTGYPWFASDLTFPGTVLLMAVVGRLLGKMWIEAAYQRSQLALLFLAQLSIPIVYLPANNQIGTSRTSLIAFTTLSIVYMLNRLAARLARR